MIDIVLGGTETPSDAIVSALAKALRLPVKLVASWVGQSRELEEPYDPPEGSDRLTRKQREALDQLIRVMIDSEENDRGNTAPIADAIEQPGTRTNARSAAPDGNDAPTVEGAPLRKDDYAKAAQSNTPRTRANRARRREEKNRIPGEDQGEGPEVGA
ncbi:MAG TPA: hypothetical protein VG502_00940 [Flexivirga sp.]|uniref:hypothetical protein n=1 Tax=Flexivirga sp. TaxID=1962927 RepID=UPI002C327869|nr:hypothetical protein [Flexivirga sp.]HWC20839.1 hypothetical protein [Flexivirga sp.]